MKMAYQLSPQGLLQCDAVDAPIQVWISPDASERESLRMSYGLDDHTISSALDPDEVARIEFDPDHTFLVWKRPTSYAAKDQFLFNVTSVGYFVFKDQLLVVAPDGSPWFGASPKHAPKNGSMLLVALNSIYASIRHYIEHLKVVKMIARELQMKINTSMENEHLIQMFSLSESLIYYLNAINANGVVLGKLRANADKMGLPAETIEYIDDIIIENNQCYKQAEIYSTVFSGLMDARGTLVNNNMSVLLKNLTIINVVFLPLNLLASIGGMSEYSMMTSRVHWWVSYSLFLLAMILLGSLMAAWLSRMDSSRKNPLKSAFRRGPWRNGSP